MPPRPTSGAEAATGGLRPLGMVRERRRELPTHRHVGFDHLPRAVEVGSRLLHVKAAPRGACRLERWARHSRAVAQGSLVRVMPRRVFEITQASRGRWLTRNTSS